MNVERLEEIKGYSSNRPIDQLKKAIVTYDTSLAIKSANQIIDEHHDVDQALDGMTESLRLIGDAFGRNEIWLPELLAASNVMESVLPLLEAEINKTGHQRKTRATVLLGTVFGDLHSIGKQMVAAMLTAHGFRVIDLGVNVSATKFVDKMIEFRPDILAMSALLTTTVNEQKKVIEILDTKGLRKNVKVIIGGGAVTQEYATSIGADGYDDSAAGAAKLAIRLIEGN